MDIIKIKDLTKEYGEKDGKVKALNSVSTKVQSGSFVSIVGASGSGKSTLLNLIGGLDTPTSGEIRIHNIDMTAIKKGELTVFRRRNIGFIFQNYSLLPVLNAYDNIALPMMLDKGIKVKHDRVETLMKEMGIWEKKERYPNELSGGQQQRIAICRALVTKPYIILADEPTGNLDSKTAMEVVMLLKTCSQKYGQTILMVTHNDSLAQISDRIIRLSDGNIVAGGE